MVAGSCTTNTPPSMACSSTISRDSVRILFTIATLNSLDVLSADMQNAYLATLCREKVHTTTGPEFDPEDFGTTILIVRALCCLKISGMPYMPILLITSGICVPVL